MALKRQMDTVSPSRDAQGDDGNFRAALSHMELKKLRLKTNKTKETYVLNKMQNSAGDTAYSINLNAITC